MTNKIPAKRRGFFYEGRFGLSIASFLNGALMLMLCLAGCSNNPSDETPVRLGYLQNDLHHLPAFVAIEKKLFDKNGVKVEVAGIFRAGPEEMSAFGAGELDIGYVGQAPATAAALNGTADIRFIAQVNLEGSAIVVENGSDCKSLDCLKGKSVAIPGHATMQDFLLRRAIRQSNLPNNAIKPIVLKPPEMIQALQQRNIDAFIAWEPYPVRATVKNNGKILMSSEDIWPEHPCCVLVASADFSKRNPDLLKRIRQTHRDACNYIRQNPDEAIVVGMQYTGMDSQTVSKALTHIRYAAELDRSKASEFVVFLESLRYVKKSGRALDAVLELVPPAQ